MREYALPSAAGHKITVTSAATSLQELIRTAIGGSSQFQIPSRCDVFEIDVESGSDVRILTDGNTPTSSNGNLIVVGEKQLSEGINLGQVSLIRAGAADAICNIRIGQSGDQAKTTTSRPGNPSSSSSPVLSNVSNAATSFAVLAANAQRKGIVIYNDSSTSVYLKFGATATTSSFSYKLAAGQTWEAPQPIHLGQIDAIADVATGTLRVTEIV